MNSPSRGLLRRLVARWATSMRPQQVPGRCGYPVRSCRTIGAGPATRYGPATLMRSWRLVSSEVHDGRAQLSQQGNGAIKRAAVPMVGYMKATSCQRGGYSRQTGDMVLRMDMICQAMMPTIVPGALGAVDGLSGTPAR